MQYCYQSGSILSISSSGFSYSPFSLFVRSYLDIIDTSFHITKGSFLNGWSRSPGNLIFPKYPQYHQAPTHPQTINLTKWVRHNLLSDCEYLDHRSIKILVNICIKGPIVNICIPGASEPAETKRRRFCDGDIAIFADKLRTSAALFGWWRLSMICVS